MASKYYYALFLDGESYAEKCLILIKYISKPTSKSLPHITLRFFDKDDPKTDYINYLLSKQITYLNIIWPGTFNTENDHGSCVVYLRCESEDLEEIDYRPDFPYSRLHITLYEGSDREYAKKLYDELTKYSWLVQMRFNAPKFISSHLFGKKVASSFDYEKACEEVLGNRDALTGVAEFSSEQRLSLVRQILANLSRCMNLSIPIVPTYASNLPIDSEGCFIDSHEIRRIAENKYVSDDFPDGLVKLSSKDKMVTQPEYARDMALCALEVFGDDSKGIHFGDSAIGTGALFIALKRLLKTINHDNKNYRLDSAIGVDIDEDRAREAYLRCSTRNLQVILNDALSPNTDLGPKRNMMLVNPPYSRSSRDNIPMQYRESIRKWAKDITGIDVPGDAGLYVYHLLIMHKWLAEDGVGVWLLPTTFLQTNYGKAVREYLTTNVQLLWLHIYNESATQFEKAIIATSIVAFKNCKPDAKVDVKVTQGNSLEQPQTITKIPLESFHNNIDNWRKLVSSATSQQNIQRVSQVRLSDLFDIKRGLATGANSFFVLKREEAREYGIPSIALRPVLPKSRYLNSLIIEKQEDGFPDVNPQLVLIDCDMQEEEIQRQYPEFYKYLQRAKEKDKSGKAIVDRTLVKSRSPWYKQELRPSPMYLFTYMGRCKANLPPLYFILNKSNAVALNTYILLYPKPWLSDMLKNDMSLTEELLRLLNTSAEIVSNQTRMYSGGLNKMEPNELKQLILPDLPPKIYSTFRNI